MSSDGLELSAAKLGHFVENVDADFGLCFLGWEVAGFQVPTDDHLPAAHLSFSTATLIVARARLPSHATTGAYFGNALVTKRWITIRVGAQNRSLRRRDDDLDADTKAVRVNRPGFTGGQNSRRIARYGTDTKEEDLEAVFT